MATFMDIISGIVIGGMLLLIALTALGTGMQTSVNHTAAEIVQLNLARSSQIMEMDLDKTGFGIPEENRSQVFQSATSSYIKVLAHLNREAQTQIPVPGVSVFDNIADTLEYSITLDDTITIGDSTLSIYKITRIIKIASVANDSSVIGKIANNNVFRFLSQTGKQTSVPAEIRILEINLRAFNPQVILSPELVMANPQSGDLEIRKRELQHLLRGSYNRQSRITLRNLQG